MAGGELKKSSSPPPGISLDLTELSHFQGLMNRWLRGFGAYKIGAACCDEQPALDTDIVGKVESRREDDEKLQGSADHSGKPCIPAAH